MHVRLDEERIEMGTVVVLAHNLSRERMIADPEKVQKVREVFHSGR